MLQENKRPTYQEQEEAKAILKRAGYYVDNLWTINDAQSKFECTDEEAYEVVGQALQNDATMSQIWFAMDFHGEDNGLTKVPDFTEFTATELFDYLKDNEVISEDATFENYMNDRTNMIDMAQEYYDNK